MRDPFSWSVPLGRLFGTTIRVHVLFPVVAVALILRVHFKKDPEPLTGTVLDACSVMALLFVAVLLHELGHCFGARLAEGDIHEVLLWPLGGLGPIEVPHRPKAHFIAVVAGPLTNLLLCLGTGLLLGVLTDFTARPPLNPVWDPYRHTVDVFDGDKFVAAVTQVQLSTWDGKVWPHVAPVAVVWLARAFWVNWILFLLNVVVIGLPLDGGRLFQCLLWPRYGFQQATQYAIFAGFVMVLIVGIVGIVMNEVLALVLALFIYATCRQQWILLESGGEDSLFGYDFSQGYSSLEGEGPPPRRPRPSAWRQWLQRRAQRKMQRQQEIRDAEERRLDELLEKVQRYGQASLTDEERRFLKRVSDRYRNRQ
jgi:hypothetical protein